MGFYRWLAERISPYLTTPVETRLITLEQRMALTDAALAELDAATNEIADELDELHAAAAAVDADLAAKIHAKADHLRALAGDADNPVPTEIPQTPEPDNGEVPGTQAGADTESQSGTEGIAGIGRA